MGISGNARGQASILVAIIFQVLFIFFAMVINVGLLVHDKINLQNSVDIAAYYGAMKQAEVLNAMGQVNYQIRQAWKLFNWRLWALSNAGRIAVLNGGGRNPAEQAVAWTDNYTDSPIVCIAHSLWYDNKTRGKENLCYRAHLSVPQPRPIKLIGAQNFPTFASILGPLAAQSQRNFDLFTADFAGSGVANYAMAMKILASYKVTVAKRRAAMQALQNLLIGQDLQDLTGHRVQDTVETVLLKNLTLPNRKTVEFHFQNSLSQHPFLVPIEVRAFVKYEDLVSSGQGNVQDVITPPQESNNPISGDLAQAFYAPDYLQIGNEPSAQEFAQETDPLHNMNSLVGFEKNPWILAYVSVSAKSHPTMLFSPFSGGQGVELTAQAYAMPFGGRIGPWYYDSWAPDSGYSSGGSKVDKLLPPRMNEQFDGGSYTPPPNYSRFPGDNLGMRSELADAILVTPLYSLPQNELPHFNGDDYANLSNVPDDPKQDPLVTSNAIPNSPIRNAEIAAIAPDLFDAVYYPVQARFSTDFGLPTVGGTFLFNSLCRGGCFDLGSLFASNPPQQAQISDQVQVASGAYHGEGFWIISNADHLDTGWTQEATDDYGGTTHPPTKVGLSVNEGGRVGYSVKLVSSHFLNNPQLPFGGAGGISGPIKNPPSP